MITSASSAFLGFIFWIIVARFYPPEDVGLGSAVISAAGLTATIANLGLGYGIIRFISQSGKNANSLLNSCFSLGTLASLVVALIFFGGLGLWSPALLFLQKNPIFLITFVILTGSLTLVALLGDAFVAERRAGFTMANSFIHGLLKLPLVVLLGLVLHASGIFASWAVSLTLTALLGIFIFLPRLRSCYRPFFTINRSVITDVVHFSAANYIANFAASAPGFLLPLMILNLLGAEANAYFYIAWTIASSLFGVSAAVSMSLFAEGSHDEGRLWHILKQSLKLTFFLLVPAVILIFAIADKLLILFGTPYSQSGTTLLRILAVSALPYAIYCIYLGIKRVEKKLTMILILSGLISAGIVVLSYILMPYLGINGVGMACLSSYGTASLVILVGWLRRKESSSG